MFHTAAYALNVAAAIASLATFARASRPNRRLIRNLHPVAEQQRPGTLQMAANRFEILKPLRFVYGPSRRLSIPREGS
jgi:hypothetical protein